MKRLPFIYYLVSIFIISVTICCEKPVDLGVDLNSTLVVTGNLTPDQPFTVMVEQSGISSNTIVQNAEVQVFNGDGELVTTLEFNDNEYISPAGVYPVEGISYTLVVQAEGFNEVTATDYIPESPRISSFKIHAKSTPDPGSSQQLFETTLVIDDFDEDNYYHLFFTYHRENTEGVFDPIAITEIVNITDDIPIINFPDIGQIFNDQAFNGLEASLSFDMTLKISNPYNPGSVEVELRSTSKKYFDFLESLAEQVNNSSPLNDPITLKSNIENGEGIFGGYSASRSTVTIR